MTTATLLLAGGGSGGHVFPLVAVADELREIAPEVELAFIGTERGMENKLLPERGYRLELVRVVPIRGHGWMGALRGIVRAALSIPEGRALIKRFAPRAVLSIGGYAAGPVSVAARIAGIPLALIEPNTVMGLANRLIAPLVQRGYTAFPEAERHFRQGVARSFGVPIRSGFDPRPYAPSDRLNVLVIGGSQGAKTLNEIVPEALVSSRAKLSVVHQCGAAHAETVRARYARLLPKFPVEVVAFIEDVPSAIGRADLVISRSGASAVSEISAIGRPALYVPYPYAAGDHQLKNAESMARSGAALCVPAGEATPERIAREIDRLAADPATLQNIAKAARERGKPHAARDIACDLLKLAGLGAAASRVSAQGAVRDDDGSARIAALSGGFADV